MKRKPRRIALDSLAVHGRKILDYQRGRKDPGAVIARAIAHSMIRLAREG